MPDQGISYRFSAAVARKPGHSVARGLRAHDRGSPDFELFRAEHEDYVSALKSAGLNVTVLNELEAYPDSVFVEDAALCLPEVTVMLRPGAPSRTAEATLLVSALEEFGHEVVRCDSDGFIDGGDILLTDSAILVGLSGRTDQRGFEWLSSLLAGWSYPVQAVQTPEGVLHFKSDCCVLDTDTVLATHRLAKAACFASFRVLTVPPGEEAAANSIRINDIVLVPAGYPATADLIADHGYSVRTVPVSQASLLDGGLSCMSLRVPLPRHTGPRS